LGEVVLSFAKLDAELGPALVFLFPEIRAVVIPVFAEFRGKGLRK
jgi:hypothetical protein